MQKTIRKKVYDTETAELIQTFISGAFGDPSGYEERLYRNPEGFSSSTGWAAKPRLPEGNHQAGFPPPMRKSGGRAQRIKEPDGEGRPVLFARYFVSMLLKPSPKTSSVETTMRKASGSVSCTMVRSWYTSDRRTAQSNTRLSVPV